MHGLRENPSSKAQNKMRQMEDGQPHAMCGWWGQQHAWDVWMPVECLIPALQVVQQLIPPAKCKSIFNTATPGQPLSFPSRLASYVCLCLFPFETISSSGWTKVCQVVGSDFPGRYLRKICYQESGTKGNPSRTPWWFPAVIFWETTEAKPTGG